MSLLNSLINKKYNKDATQGYELTFAGKGFARAEYSLPTKYILKEESAQSKLAENTQNVVIKGDNIEVLKILKQNYMNKIKMIYIDPPYNTGNDGFIYKDNFKQTEKELIEFLGLEEDYTDYLHNIFSTKTHSAWLSFMYPRLRLARDLLKEDGVIFVSIDDNEQANLKIIMDEIFGAENFVINFIRKTVSNRAMAKYKNTQHEYLLSYSKNINNLSFLGELKNFSSYSNSDDDPNGSWKSANPSRVGGYQYELKNPYTGKIDIPPIGRGWVFKEEMIPELLKNGILIFKKEHKPNERGFLLKSYLKNIRSEHSLVNSLETTDNRFMNQAATKELNKLLNNKLFSFPKPLQLIKFITKISTKDDDIVLDFFAGSGTTGHSVMQLNSEDGGNRKYILVQLEEKISEDQFNESYNFCIENKLPCDISSITIERLNRAGDKIKEELEGKLENKNISEEEQSKIRDILNNIDIGYRVFSLLKKPDINIDTEKKQLELVNNNYDSKTILLNMLIATGESLLSKCEEIEEESLYKYNNKYYLIKDLKGSIHDLEINPGCIFYINPYNCTSLQQSLELSQQLSKDNIILVY